MDLTVTITVNMDNAAFEDYPDELRRILHAATSRICVAIDQGLDIDAKLFDINGNTVGEAIGSLDE